MLATIANLKKRIFYGWWILGLGSLINAIGIGILYHSFTVFFLPLKRDLGVSSAAVSLLYGAARLEGGLEGPIVGHLIDRFGSRMLIFIGASLAGIGLIILATVDSFWAFFLIYVFIVSLGSNAGFFHPVTAIVNKWFIRYRGLSFSIVSASGSIGGMVMAPLLSFIILNYGWRQGAIFAGIVILLIALPSALPMKRTPESMGLYPDGRPLEEEKSIAHQAHLSVKDVDFPVREALRSTPFWLLGTAIALRLSVTVALNTHFVPILVWRGMSEATSAYLVSLTAFSSIFFSLALGWLGDRWPKSYLSALCSLPMVLSMMTLAFSEDALVLYFFPIAFAIIYGTAPLNWALIGDFFGRRIYATIRGIMGVGYGIGTFISPIFAGWIFDKTNSYFIVLIVFSVILTAAAILFIILSHPSRWYK